MHSAQFIERLSGHCKPCLKLSPLGDVQRWTENGEFGFSVRKRLRHLSEFAGPLCSGLLVIRIWHGTGSGGVAATCVCRVQLPPFRLRMR